LALTPTAMAKAHAISPFAAGIKCRCPRCGEGKLFAGYLKLAERCGNCGLEFDFADSGDGPAVLIMLIVGFVVVGMALVTEMLFAPPVIVHLLVWIPVSLALALWLLRPFKATFIALQFANDAGEARR
jgi:uncharacterized protein (DUF983 family)